DRGGDWHRDARDRIRFSGCSGNEDCNDRRRVEAGRADLRGRDLDPPNPGLIAPLPRPDTKVRLRDHQTMSKNGGNPTRAKPDIVSSSIVVSRSLALICILALLTAGCSTHTQKYLEPRDIGDKVTEGDLDAFLQVVNDLPDKKLPEIPVL